MNEIHRSTIEEARTQLGYGRVQGGSDWTRETVVRGASAGIVSGILRFEPKSNESTRLARLGCKAA